ncbi:hypothetical protein [Sphingosinicella humi]|uniref:UrcA family protein n=1 Tax=Allosphingosinicella humi TaxID=2068657 RepID=A0A2U2J212_9SPHN|nr:hypothetical protein [Sphingosinicella humi]PWG02379.1 hypothetical protein DF286_05505 [Sphingosinicella humi]
MRTLSLIAMAAIQLAPGAVPTIAKAASEPADGEASQVDRQGATTVHRSDCLSIQRQVAGEDRRYPGMRLDQQPPGRLLHAVDRQVDGCRTVTFVAEERVRRSRER